MSRLHSTEYRPSGAEFPDDFPQRLERLREASGLTWRALARELGVSVRSLHRWRAGTRPDAAHMLAIVEFATERELLACLLGRTNVGPADERQALLFGEDVWTGLHRARVASGGAGATRRAA